MGSDNIETTDDGGNQSGTVVGPDVKDLSETSQLGGRSFRSQPQEMNDEEACGTCPAFWRLRQGAWPDSD